MLKGEGMIDLVVLGSPIPVISIVSAIDMVKELIFSVQGTSYLGKQSGLRNLFCS